MWNFPDLEKLFKSMIGCAVAAVIGALILGLALGWLIFG